jgi:hypothetical protein
MVSPIQNLCYDVLPPETKLLATDRDNDDDMGSDSGSAYIFVNDGSPGLNRPNSLPVMALPVIILVWQYLYPVNMPLLARIMMMKKALTAVRLIY